MTPPHASQQAQPWWADVAHLRDDATGQVASATRPAERAAAPSTRAAAPTAERAHARERHPRGRQDTRRRSNGQRRTAGGAAARPDWFAQDALSDGRVQRPQASQRPERPRARLVDVAPDHAILSRPLQVRRNPGERPTVTITGRPDAALPPRPSEPRHIPARRTRETLSSLVASPDRLILWAVALGLLMILASLGTANADAATLIPSR
jgi:hypothetical protein